MARLRAAATSVEIFPSSTPLASSSSSSPRKCPGEALVVAHAVRLEDLDGLVLSGLVRALVDPLGRAPAAISSMRSVHASATDGGVDSGACSDTDLPARGLLGTQLVVRRREERSAARPNANTPATANHRAGTLRYHGLLARRRGRGIGGISAVRSPTGTTGRVSASPPTGTRAP